MAADLAQESYARVYAAQLSGAGIVNPRALLYRTARNLVIDHYRHAEVRTGVELSACEAEAEHSGSYTTGATSTATKLNLSIRETPQTISVITRQRLEDQGINSMAEVLN